MGMAQVIDLSGLPEPLIEAIGTIVRAYRGREVDAPAAPRSVGWARDVLPELPSSFFDPLPDELLSAFEGKLA
jgi:hypothetical protein